MIGVVGCAALESMKQGNGDVCPLAADKVGKTTSEPNAEHFQQLSMRDAALRKSDVSRAPV